MRIPRHRRRLVWVVAALGLLALLAVAGRGLAGRLVPRGVSVLEVQRGRFTRTVTADGTLRAVQTTPIVVPIETQMNQKIGWLAQDGVFVKKGEPVVLFDPYDLEKLLADGRSDRATAERKIEKASTEGAKSSQSLELDREVAKDDLRRAQEMPPVEEGILSRNTILETQIDRTLLEARSKAAERKLGLTSERGAADVALGEIEQSKADLRIRMAERGLASLRIVAPHDGFFVLERDWRGNPTGVGEMVWPGQSIAEIPDLARMEARVYVLEADAGSLEPGKRATVVVEGHASASHAAVVARVDAVAKPRDNGSPVKYFETVLTLDEGDDSALRPGQRVRAQIVLEEREEAIAIPRGAVFERDGKRIVHRLRGGRFEPAPVGVGPHSLGRVVIESGLAPGDRIALRDPSLSAHDILGTQAGKPASEGAP